MEIEVSAEAKDKQLNRRVAISVVIFSVAISTIRMGRFRPLLMLGATGLALLLATGIDIQNSFDRRAERFQAVNKFVPYALTDYLASGWNKMPTQRINLAGRPSDTFQFQWVGPVDKLNDVLRGQNFESWKRWSCHDAIPYLNPASTLHDMAPNPVVHEGLRAKATASSQDPSHADQRVVLRAFQSNAQVLDGGAKMPVYLVNITHERVKRDLGLFAVPSDQPAEADEVSSLIGQLAADPKVEILAAPKDGQKTITILRPKS